MEYSKSLAALLLACVMAACGLGSSAETISGEIRDDVIVLPVDQASHDLWVELQNTGSQPCELLAVLSASPPDRLPTHDGRIQLTRTGDPAEAYPMEAYIEVDGQPWGGAEGGEGQPASVAPGQTARIQLAQTGIPDAGERVITCNGPGDYEQGRYAALRYER